ncbi:MAG: ABC transporter permease subunit [Caldilineaceae bacterium]|nr:ABC transporter permease subunit [Caldilineaceae bacterium]
MSADESVVNVRPKKRNWAPYWLILPSLIYLLLFFAYPMVQGLSLSIWDKDAKLELHAAATSASESVGELPRGSQVAILERQANVLEADVAAAENLVTEIWYLVQAEDVDGQSIEGWTSESRVRVREEDETGRALAGTIRRKLASGADPLTEVYAEPSGVSEVIGKLDANAAVAIQEQTILEIWYLIAGDGDNATEGWTQSRYIQVYSDEETGRIDQGNAGEFTTRYLQRMVNDRFFWPALWTTLLLMVLIIPLQFVLAIIMALVIQQQLKGNSFFLYVFAIALGVSDLAVGIVWYSVFTQYGYLNSILQSIGLISQPIAYLTADTRYWILIAIVLAEVWRATSIVMVIVVSGLQAIPAEVIEASEIFGAGLWQRIRHVILPMLRPSLQVALILRTILALQVFAVVIALSGGDVVTVLANETYRQYNELRNINVAAAYSALILIISMVSAVFYLQTVRTQEEGAG